MTRSFSKPNLPLRRRSGMARQRGGKNTPTVYIGMSMFCLVIVYMIAVVAITKSHLKEEDDNALTIHHPHEHVETGISLRERIDQHQSGKNPTDTNSSKKKETAEEKKRRNPFRKHRLELGFGHGVKPQVVLDDKQSQQTTDQVGSPKQAEGTHPNPEFMLKAFLEPIKFDDFERTPLPVREQPLTAIKQVSYPQVNSCSKLIEQWPVDDSPAHKDTFLPWIHDVFPTHDGQYVQFVAQNLRRCATGDDEKHLWAEQRIPQASLFQHVSVKRVNVTDDKNSTRYRLSNHEEADPDGLATRFICRFKPSMEETLSEYNFDYDWTALRKRYRGTFMEDDGGIKSIHTSQLTFKCPVPPKLQADIAAGKHVQNDFSQLFVDIIPIRTPPRFGPSKQFLQPKYKLFLDNNVSARFDPDVAYGKNHVLPAIERSGRWENIPICLPSLMQYENKPQDEVSVKADAPVSVSDKPVKKHRLVSCIWASAGYATRGNRFAINDGQRRLLEWISYNKVIGFDHFYVYDNSGAFSNSSSLKGVADLFPDDVTYIPWPSAVCNNNPNNVDSPGERSSQYAAEASCRLRFGPHVDWIGQFDIDEYLIPMGNHSNIPTLLDELEKEDTRIISFGSWRAWPRWAFINDIQRIDDSDVCWHNEPCFDLSIPINNTMLQAYNCDRQPPGKKSKVMPAEKQLYRPDYVLQHFIHYSAVTTLSEKNETEYVKEGFRWKHRAFPDPRQRFGDELTEALMIHTKAVAVQDTSGWERMCHVDNLKLPVRKQGLCRLGVPWPPNPSPTNATEDGWAYNCYVNKKVEEEFVPQLVSSLRERAPHFFETK